MSLLISCLVDMCSSNSDLTDKGKNRNLPSAKIIIISPLPGSRIPEPCLDSRECFPSRKYPRTQVLLGSSQETPAVHDLLNDSSRGGMEIVRMIIRREARGSQHRGSSRGVKNGSCSQRVCDGKGGKELSSFWADGLVDSRSVRNIRAFRCPSRGVQRSGAAQSLAGVAAYRTLSNHDFNRWREISTMKWWR